MFEDIYNLIAISNESQMNLILCGLPMSGKSTIGERLAKRLDRPFIDIDRMIEQAYFTATGIQRSCRQICQVEGEKIFRKLEKEQISSLNDVKNHIIALGGGTLSDKDNQRLIQQIGEIVYLKTTIDHIWQQLELHEIPSYLDQHHPKEHFYTIAKMRIAIFEQISQNIIDISQLSEDEITNKIMERSGFTI